MTTDKNKCSLCCQGGPTTITAIHLDESGIADDWPQETWDAMEPQATKGEERSDEPPKHTQEYEYMETLIADMAVALDDLFEWTDNLVDRVSGDFIDPDHPQRVEVMRLIDDAEALLELGRERE